MKQLFYGDNLEVLRRYIADESVDLCYIDPPFNSKRNYFQIYNNIGKEDLAQAQAFVDTWTWDEQAARGFADIINNDGQRFTDQTIELIRGLRLILKEGGLFAYIISMTLRITEIHRVLKETGSFYLHCDPTASHYLKLVLDAVFCSRGGNFLNEIIWCYRKWSIVQKQFVRNHDVIFFYSKSSKNTFNTQYVPLSPGTVKRWKGKKQQAAFAESGQRTAGSLEEESKGSAMPDWWEISIINPASKERLGYPTQKPEALLERIIQASSQENDVVLDAYCGCGTTVAVSQRLQRNWIGIDITYQSISLILKRLEDTFGKDVLKEIQLNGIPRDMASARALANKQDDRLRKEFEKWALLTYSNNRAVLNLKKGADKGIDGTAYFMISKNDTAKAVFQVKSGKVNRATVATLRGDLERENAALAYLITLETPSKPMQAEAAAAGLYEHSFLSRTYPRIQIVTIEEMIMQNKRLDLPLSVEVVKKAQVEDPRHKQETLL